MKSEAYQRGYKYGYKIGVYKATCDTNLRMFKDIFKNEFIEERKKIKWLSNYELDLLFDVILDGIRYFSKNGANDREETDKYKAKILKLLR